MGTDRHDDAGTQWREDLPESWEECRPVPPLASGTTEDPEVIKREHATVFTFQESETAWVRAHHEDVRYPEDYR